MRIILSLLTLCMYGSVVAQLSKKHYIPPLYYPLGENESVAFYSDTPCGLPYVNEQELSLSTDSTTPISVTITDGSGNPLPGPPVTISSGSPMTLTLGNEDENTPMMVPSSRINNVVSNKGLILESNHSFYASVRIGTNINKCFQRPKTILFDGEFIVSKGEEALGTSFRLATSRMNVSERNKVNGTYNHYVGILATEDNTNVRMSDYPSNMVFGVYDPIRFRTQSIYQKVNANIRQDILLNKGQSIVLVVSGTDAYPFGFTGALLSSDKPIAVNTGSLYGQDFDLMVDQIVPISSVGKQYGMIRGKETSNDKYEYGIVVATESNTTVSIDGVQKTTLANAGDYYIVNYPDSTTKNLYIETSKSVYLYQVLAGSEGKISSRSGVYQNFTTGFNFIPPLSEYSYSYIDMIPRINQIGDAILTESYVSILTKDSNKNIRINGTLISAPSEPLIGSNGWVAIQQSIPSTTNNVRIESEGPIAVGVFGASNSLGYSGYFSGFNLLETQICISAPMTDIFTYMGRDNPSATGTPGTWSPSFDSNSNIFNPAIDTSADYTYTYTAASGDIRTELVKITVVPDMDIRGMDISNLPAKECLGTDISYELQAPNLVDGDYKITYTLEYMGMPIITKTDVVTVVMGKTRMTIDAADITRGGGTYTLKLTKIDNDVCTSNLSINKNIEITPRIDENDISLDNGCVVIDPTATTTVILNNRNPYRSNDIYTIVYQITGANTTADTTVEVNMTNTRGQIVIPAGTLTQAGDNSVTIKSIVHKGNPCATSTNVKSVLKTIHQTSLISMNNSVANPCTLTEQTVDIVLDNAIVGQMYQMLYSLSGQNNRPSTQIDIVPDAAGKASFTIPASYFPNKGITTISIISSPNCDDRVVNPSNITTDINMNLTPAITDADIIIPDYICFGSDLNISIQNNKTLENGASYTLKYRISGANTTGELTHTQVVNNQKIDFVIPASSLPVGGITSLDILSIATNNGCPYAQTTSKSFTVVQIDLSMTNYEELNQCDGTSLIRINNPNIPITDGDYKLDYTINGQTQTLETKVERGFVRVIIPRSLFVEGQNILTLNTLTHILSGCSASFINETHQIEKQGLLDFAGISAAVPPLFCKSDNDMEVILNIPTSSVSSTSEFVIEYELSGANVHTQISQKITIDSDRVIFSIPIKYLNNRGNTTITIRKIRAENKDCEGDNTNLSKDFFVSVSPSISSQEIAREYYFCEEDNPVLSDIYLKSSLANNIFWYKDIETTQEIQRSSKLVRDQKLYARRKNEEGCLSTSVSANINFELCDNINIPTKISVNGDNINDKFDVKDLGKIYPNYAVNIYNRNGILIYKDNSTTESFIGYPNQSKQILNTTVRLPKGIYYYVLFYNNLVKDKKPIQGYFYMNY